MKGRLAKCPRCNRIYEIQSMYEDVFLGTKKDLGTMITKDEEYFCQKCQESLKKWRNME